MKATDIRELTKDELTKELSNHRDELFNLKIQAKTGVLENVARAKTVRRIIARILTELNVRSKQEIAK